MSDVAELELTRSRDDRRLYEIARVGTLRFEGFFARRATAEAGAETWSFERRGVFRTTIEASDAAGAVVGSFAPRALGRGGAIRWGDHGLELRPASMWTERYALADDERELAVLDAKSWGKRPVSITIDEIDLVAPGLVLFTAFAVRQLAEDASSNAGGASAAAATG
jgi:hypothetical protein